MASFTPQPQEPSGEKLMSAALADYTANDVFNQLNNRQIALDVFGAGYVLDGETAPNNPTPLVNQAPANNWDLASPGYVRPKTGKIDASNGELLPTASGISLGDLADGEIALDSASQRIVYRVNGKLFRVET